MGHPPILTLASTKLLIGLRSTLPRDKTARWGWGTRIEGVLRSIEDYSLRIMKESRSQG